MSYKTYYLEWEAAQAELQELLQEEHSIRENPLHKRSALVASLQRLYVRCLLASHRLNACHDCIRQPQRRQLLRTLLDLTLLRLLEIKHEVCALDASDTLHCDHLMTRARVQPQQLLHVVPHYFRRDRENLLLEREACIAACLEQAGAGAVEDSEAVLSVAEAITTVQRHERARQARARALQFRALLSSKDRDRGLVRTAALGRDEAAVLIQARVRGILARQRVQEMRTRERTFLGMENNVVDTSVQQRLQQVRLQAYDSQGRLREELQQQEQRVRTELLYRRAPGMLQALEDGIREWIFEVKRDTGKFPDIPDEEEGGSLAVDGLTDPLTAAQPTEEDKEEEEETTEAPETTEEEQKQVKVQAVDQPDEQEEQHVLVRSSAVLADLQDACRLYKAVWQPLGAGTVEEAVELGLVEEQQRHEVTALLRARVDVIMRQQLQKLKEDVEGEKKGARKKKRTKKGSKKGRRRREKDLTPDQTTESLFEELVINGIVKSVASAPALEELEASVCLVGSQVMNNRGWPAPQYGDFLNTLVEYVALPLGLECLHTRGSADSLSPALVRSVVVVGSRGCGASSAVMAVARSVGALLLDLTATNIVGRYPGRAGLAMLLHLVLKVGRLLQPTIILVDNADRTFLKKVPKTDKSEPRRLRKELPRLVKSIATEDRVVLVGISNAPWNCDLKSLTSVYQKVLLVPRPSYSTRAHLWRQQLRKLNAVVGPSLDMSCLARLTDGYTPDQICQVAKQAVNLKKKISHANTAIAIQEFLPYLAKQEPLYREEEEALNNWFLKIPLMKKRLNIFEETVRLNEISKAKSSKSGKRKSKKNQS